jgi:hypothetical protein
MRRFATGLLGRLYHRNRHPLHLMIDEADLFAPQRPGKDETTLLGAMEDLVRRGRAKGLGVTLITQRPAVLHKDVLTQVSTLVCHRLVGPQDRNALDAWVQGNGTREQRDEMMETLASLPTGTAWFWSPHWLDLFKRIKIRKARTFDSSATPGRGQRIIEPRVRAEVNLASLTQRIADTIERAKENDPRELKAEISRLRRDLAAAAEREAHPSIEVQEVEVLVPYIPPGFEEAISKMNSVGSQIVTSGQELIRFAVDLGQAINNLPVRDAPEDHKRWTSRGTSRGTETVPQSPKSQVKAVPRRDTPADSNGVLKKAERLILTALAQYHPKSRSVRQIATLTGYASNGGGFRNAMSALNVKQYIEGGKGEWVITEAGFDALGAFDELPVGQALIDHWLDHFGPNSAHRKILEYLTSIYPDHASPEQIAEATGYVASGGGFRNAMSKLNTLELIEGGRGAWKASDDFYG